MFFWLRKGSSNKYVHSWQLLGYGEVTLNVYSFVHGGGGGGVKHHVYLRTYTISFHVPLFIFVLECLVLFEEM